MSGPLTDSSPRALIVMGVSGSGKSTIAERLAARLRWVYEDADAFHPPANIARMRAGIPLTDSDRASWLDALAGEIDKRIAHGDRLVLACSALKRAYRKVLVHGRADVRIVYLKGSRDLIASRIATRKDHFMPSELLDSQFDSLEEPTACENPVTVDIDAPVERIVDHIVAELHLQER